MCYVIAKDRYGHGCIAFETVHGKHLADLKWSLDEALGNTGVEIMTISHPEAYLQFCAYLLILLFSRTHLPTHLRTAILVEKRCENYYTLPKISCSYL